MPARNHNTRPSTPIARQTHLLLPTVITRPLDPGLMLHLPARRRHRTRVAQTPAHAARPLPATAILLPAHRHPATDGGAPLALPPAARRRPGRRRRVLRQRRRWVEGDAAVPAHSRAYVPLAAV